MITFERVTYLPSEGGRPRTIFLEGPTVIGELLTGIEVDREGTEVAPKGIDERRHIISLDLVSQRTPMVIDKMYGELVER